MLVTEGIEGSQHSGSNRGPTVYKTVALPLSYAGVRKGEAATNPGGEQAERLQGREAQSMAAPKTPALSPRADLRNLVRTPGLNV